MPRIYEFDLRSRTGFDKFIASMIKDKDFRVSVFKDNSESVKEALKIHTETFWLLEFLLKIPEEITEMDDGYEKFEKIIEWAAEVLGFS